MSGTTGKYRDPSLCSPSSSTIDRPCPEGRPGSKSYASHLRAEKFTPPRGDVVGPGDGRGCCVRRSKMSIHVPRP